MFRRLSAQALRGRVRRSLSLESLERRQVLSASGLPDLSSLGVELGADHASDRVLVRFQEGAAPAALGDIAREQLGGSPWWKVAVEPGRTVGQTIAALRGRNDVLYVQPDYRVSITDHNDPTNPNDEFYQDHSLWGLSNNGKDGGTVDADIDANEAWAITTGEREVVVAVIDTGVDYNHPDLAANIWMNVDEIPGNGVDDDGNGYVDDVRGWDFHNNDNDPMDDHSHGTHVAGTIGAVANNYDPAHDNAGQGMVGVAWNVQIMPLKFLDAQGSGYLSNAIPALQYAVDNGAKISNNSWGWTGGADAALGDAIDQAADAGHLFVAAAGNGNWLGMAQDNDNNPHYPSSYQPNPDTVLAIAASDRTDTHAGFSNYGRTSVDIAAPGVQIWSTIPFALDGADFSIDGYARYSGTSMAAPHVAGAAALVWSVNPDLSAGEVKQIILETGDPYANSRRPTVTDDRLNAGRAVEAAQATLPADARPSVEITSPVEGAAVSGGVTVAADASDDGGVNQVEFFVDGQSIGTDTDGSDGWSWTSWDTTVLNEGSYTITATATDTAGQTASHSITVTVDNVDDPPEVAITSPADGETVSGVVTVTADASDDRGVSQVEFFVGEVSIGTDTNGADGWSAIWDTGGLAEGSSHTIEAVVTDDGGNTGSDSITVTVAAASNVHVGDLDASQNVKGKSGKWEAFVTVLIHNHQEAPVAGATVTGAWSGAGSGVVSGTTGADGTVVLGSGNLSGGTNITFTVTKVAGSLSYDAKKNHDPDADSDGTTITIAKAAGRGQAVSDAEAGSLYLGPDLNSALDAGGPTQRDAPREVESDWGGLHSLAAEVVSRARAAASREAASDLARTAEDYADSVEQVFADLEDELLAEFIDA